MSDATGKPEPRTQTTWRRLRAARPSPSSLALFAVVVGSLWLGRAWMRGAELIEDERFHAQHVHRFLQGDFSLHPKLTTLPGYHVLLYGVARVVGRSKPNVLRQVSTVLGALSVFFFWLAARRLHGRGAPLAAAQLLYLPALFPYFFLIYTDALSLCLILLAMLLWIHVHPHWASWVVIASVFVRQDNVVFLLFFVLLLIGNRDPRWIRKSATALFGLTFFAVFVIQNHGVALGDRTAHPFPSFHLVNVYFTLWLLCAFSPFLLVSSARRVMERLRRDRRPLVILSALFLLYLLTMQNTHPYNQNPDEYLRNQILVFVMSRWLIKALFFIPIAFALLLLWVTPLRSGAAIPLYVCVVLSLGAHWLVEPRYAILPIALFTLLRERRSSLVESLDLSWNAALSWALFLGIARRAFFP
jgi:alpha-1,2-glucosyltransferase